jgi:integral membrane protein
MISTLLQTTLGRLRIVAFLEGISFLILLGIAMPLKYFASYPGPVRVVGMIHGILFIGYVLFLALTKSEHRWSFGKTTLAFIASLVPFGTFYADKKWFRN